MPYGTVTQLNSSTGHGRIDTDSGWYTVEVDDMEPKARAEKAKVDFDVQRDEPFDRAVNVRLREGTHNAPTQRRFGDSGG